MRLVHQNLFDDKPFHDVRRVLWARAASEKKSRERVALPIL
jgi:hypothetical protein